MIPLKRVKCWWSVEGQLCQQKATIYRTPDRTGLSVLEDIWRPRTSGEWRFSCG